jgi:mono/diheme cytochrome c family protein
MSHFHRAHNLMKWNLVVSALLAVNLLGCTGKRGQGEPGATDSTRVADTSQQVALPVRSVSYEERQGAVLYRKYCSVCHGTEGKGDGFNAFNLDPRPRDFSDSTFMKALSDDQLLQTISGGGRSVNKSPLMPSYRGTLSRQQISYIAKFIRSRSSGG